VEAIKVFFSKSVLIFSLLFGLIVHAQTVNRPNVILILSDDQGFADYSINGNPALETPAIDRIAQEGVRFSDFHVSPYCTPTRGQLLSGMDALHNQAATVGTGRNTMRRDIVTLPEVFRQNGYKTGIFGKWHLGDNYPDRPMDRGFDKSIWFPGWGLLSEYEYDNDYYKTRFLDNEALIQSDQYCTDLWFSKAKEWMGEMASQHQPFFAYIPTNAPHGPFLSLPEDYQFYRNKGLDSSTAAFFGMLRNIDKNVADLDQWLERHQLKENTIVIYINDNGGTGGVKFYNAGMKGMKGQVYEGGHRASCFIRWPQGNLGVNRIINTTAEVQDLLPTFIDLLDLKHSGLKKQLDGVSLKPVLKQNGNVRDRMFVVQYGGSDRPQKYFSCVVWNDWRLVGKDELYNIKDDLKQEHNLAAGQPEVLKKMQAFYENWWNALQPEIKSFVPIIIGCPAQPSLILTSDFWADSAYINTQWKVALAQGPATGGKWHVKVLRDGIYRIELSRWPFHLNRSLVSEGVGMAVGGYKLRKGKALPIQYGCLSINDKKIAAVKKKAPDAKLITLDIPLTRDVKTIQAWFKDKKQNDLCGAYYLRIRWLKAK